MNLECFKTQLTNLLKEIPTISATGQCFPKVMGTESDKITTYTYTAAISRASFQCTGSYDIDYTSVHAQQFTDSKNVWFDGLHDNNDTQLITPP